MLLVVLRLVQGLGAGAESLPTMIIGSTPDGRRAMYSAFGSSGFAGGVTLALMVFLGISSVPTEVLLDWAWRIPFIAGGAIFAMAWFIRRRVEETPGFLAAQDDRMAAADSSSAVPTASRGGVGFCVMIGVSVYGYIVNAYTLSDRQSRAMKLRARAFIEHAVRHTPAMLGTC